MDKYELVHLRARDWLEEVTGLLNELGTLRLDFFHAEKLDKFPLRPNLSIGLLNEDRSFRLRYESLLKVVGRLESLRRRMSGCHEAIEVGPLVAFRLQIDRVESELAHLVNAVQQGTTSGDQVNRLRGDYDLLIGKLKFCVTILENVVSKQSLSKKLLDELVVRAGNAAFSASFPYSFEREESGNGETFVFTKYCTETGFANFVGLQPNVISAIAYEKRNAPGFSGPNWIYQDGDRVCDFYELAEFVVRHTPVNGKRQKCLIPKLKRCKDLPESLRVLINEAKEKVSSSASQDSQPTV